MHEGYESCIERQYTNEAFSSRLATTVHLIYLLAGVGENVFHE